eukprot:CAMPEP_0119002986 /NCGR_PEP_ID=MMETSP1176-20130426/279_1 /TAXON_ID=265551 /ORGANISM="Synedropsis recta cf, Strain CCMP1620" /LENGTH=196 /DNA_ID=CAMNT_0006954535 /DNA_START=130 /DNA_END=720 /DNA_ORIENTATION=+
MATRAVGKKPVAKKAPVKKVVKKAPVKKVIKKAPPKKVIKKAAPKKKAAPRAVSSNSGGYPSFTSTTEAWKPFSNISGGGNKGPSQKFEVADFSNPALQIARDPAFYAAAAATRLTSKQNYVIDDGLTNLERKQRKTIPTFLTGSAKSQADASAIRDDVVAEEFAFGLDADNFQLLFISVFGLLTLVGCLSGALEL